jgi:hypothetical protein
MAMTQEKPKRKQKRYVGTAAQEERYLATSLEYRRKNRAKIAEASRVWRLKNKDRHTAKTMACLLKRLERKAGRSCPEVCEVCGEKDKWGGRLCFDHCHSTGIFRGWLCRNCNSTIGIVDDNIERLRALADYLERHNAK